MITYVTVKCSRCLSTSQFRLTSVSSEDFVCPVCSEGNIRPLTEMCDIDGGECKIPFPEETLFDIWRNSR